MILVPREVYQLILEDIPTIIDNTRDLRTFMYLLYTCYLLVSVVTCYRYCLVVYNVCSSDCYRYLLLPVRRLELHNL